jgi:hypothetical protein
VLHEQIFAGDHHCQDVPGAGNEDQDETVSDQVQPPPEDVLVKQRVDPRPLETDPEQSAEHVDQQQDTGGRDDDDVQADVDRASSNRGNRQIDDVLGLPALEEVAYCLKPMASLNSSMEGCCSQSSGVYMIVLNTLYE